MKDQYDTEVKKPRKDEDDIKILKVFGEMKCPNCQSPKIRVDSRTPNMYTCVECGQQFEVDY